MPCLDRNQLRRVNLHFSLFPGPPSLNACFAGRQFVAGTPTLASPFSGQHQTGRSPMPLNCNPRDCWVFYDNH
jgi:hypothetical protein